MNRTGSSVRRILTSAFSILALVVAVVLAVWLTGDDTGAQDSPGPGTAAPSSAAPSSAAPDSSAPGTGTAGAPARVLDTLALIDDGRWPEAANAPGTQGGRTFRNNEGLLPRTGADGRRLQFQEWDVNPKQRGRGRDAERIITANDGSAWYTLDHYEHFTRIRGPAG